MEFNAALSDHDLLQLLKVDNRLAFRELYNRYWKSMFNVAQKRVRDKETCEDIIHDIFADLWEKRLLREIHDLLPYLHTAVRNKIYSLLAKGHALPEFVEPFENMAQSTLTADGLHDEKELLELILLLLKAIPEKRREIFRMRYFEDRSTAEIAESLQISQKTVQNQLLTATGQLRSAMEKFLTILIIIEFHKH